MGLAGWPERLLKVVSSLENQTDDHLCGLIQERVPRCRGWIPVTSMETSTPSMIQGMFNSNIPSPLGLHHLATSIHALSHKAQVS